MKSIVAGIHPVREALRAQQPLSQVTIAQGAGGHRLRELIELCRQQGVPVRHEPRASLDRMSAGAVHQGVVATLAATSYGDYASVVHEARLLVVLDGVEDPHNLGAIVRSACGAGASGIIIPERRAANVTEVVAKAAAGALAYVPVVRVTNLNRTLEDLKARGYWVYGLDERGEQAYHQAEYVEPTVLVLGSEGAGLHEQVRKHCDGLVRIPLTGPISSLNVSVAAAVVLFEWKRRHDLAAPPAGETPDKPSHHK